MVINPKCGKRQRIIDFMMKKMYHTLYYPDNGNVATVWSTDLESFSDLYWYCFINEIKFNFLILDK